MVFTFLSFYDSIVTNSIAVTETGGPGSHFLIHDGFHGQPTQIMVIPVVIYLGVMVFYSLHKTLKEVFINYFPDYGTVPQCKLHIDLV